MWLRIWHSAAKIFRLLNSNLSSEICLALHSYSRMLRCRDWFHSSSARLPLSQENKRLRGRYFFVFQVCCWVCYIFTFLRNRFAFRHCVIFLFLRFDSVCYILQDSTCPSQGTEKVWAPWPLHTHRSMIHSSAVSQTAVSKMDRDPLQVCVEDPAS
jgi:hypothetical protein